LCDTRVCDHNIERAEFLDRGSNKGLDFGELGDVCDMPVGFAPEGFNFFDGLERKRSARELERVWVIDMGQLTSSMPALLAATSLMQTSNPSSASRMAIALPLVFISGIIIS
jgi:hypothetical protein